MPELEERQENHKCLFFNVFIYLVPDGPRVEADRSPTVVFHGRTAALKVTIHRDRSTDRYLTTHRSQRYIAHGDRAPSKRRDPPDRADEFGAVVVPAVAIQDGPPSVLTEAASQCHVPQARQRLDALVE